VLAGAMKLLSTVAGARVIGRPAERLLSAATGIVGQSIPATEVLRVVAAVEAEGVACWLGGGWGVDALLGFESRWHGDLDLVVDDHDAALPRVAAALEGLGYRWRSSDRGAVWLPHRSAFESSRGYRIEMLGIDWEVLETAWSLLRPTPTALPRHLLRERCFATGVVGGRLVNCLSEDAQRLFHCGYPPRDGDLQDLSHLNAGSDAGVAAYTTSPPGTTALMIPVFGLEDGARQLWTESNHDNGGLPPHVTILYPFLPLEQISEDVLERLAAVCAAHHEFDFALDSTNWFDGRVLYLSPSSSEPFVSLTRRLVEEFPSCAPYEGAYAEIVPHLTVRDGGRRTALQRAQRRIRRHLPIRSRARHLFLMSSSDASGQWTIERSIPLRTESTLPQQSS
jgi:hypothetical protein